MAVTYSFPELLQAVEAYYGAGTDQWVAIAQYGISAENAASILKQIPGVNTVVNESGQILEWSLETTLPSTAVETVGGAINSNAQLPAYAAGSGTVNVPANIIIDAETGEIVASSGSVTAAGTKAFTIAQQVAAPVILASSAITLGKWITEEAYEHGTFMLPESIAEYNPAAFREITRGDDSVSGKIFNFLYKIDQEGEHQKAQAYIDERALAYMALYMQVNGAFEQEEITIDDTSELLEPTKYYLPLKPAPNVVALNNEQSFTFFDSGYTLYHEVEGMENGSHITHISLTPFSYDETAFGVTTRYYVNTPHVGINGQVYYSFEFGNALAKTSLPISTNYIRNTTGINQEMISDWAYILYNGRTIEGVPGVPTQPGGVIPDLAGVTTIAAAIEILKNLYPELWDNAITNTSIQPDGTTTTTTYVPSGTPESISDVNKNPITGNVPQNNTVVNPDSAGQTSSVVDNMTSPPNPPDTGSGSTPPIIPPVGSASALWSIYNPTQSEVNQFGAWLWSSDFVDQLKKLFNDPMQSIIGLHKVFASPVISGTGTIKVGYLNSGVGSKLVGAQYTTVACGSVNVREYFGNVFDYDPYTKISLYLPFIGIVPLNVSDVMRSTVTVTYHVDVLTGACLAEVNIKRDNAGGILYTYSGNAAVQYPISSGSYMGIVSSIVSVAGAVIGTVASGGSLAPVALGATNAALHAHTNVQHSGSLSGNSGAMGAKKPYIIISRPQTAMPYGFNEIEGIPSNGTVILGSCKGYTKVKEMHVDGIGATADELSEIEALLKEGVIL